MIDEDLMPRGIRDARVLAAFAAVPRHLFVRAADTAHAYDDRALAIDEGQTISQPYIVALMTQCLRLTGVEKVLEIGTGSGYQAAILSQLASEVYTVERSPILAESARARLARLGYANCHVTNGDGTVGWSRHAPYDGIVVTAAAPSAPPSLISQLRPGARLVIPVGDRWQQALTVIERSGDRITTTHVCSCVFVPLIGKEGWRIDRA